MTFTLTFDQLLVPLGYVEDTKKCYVENTKGKCLSLVREP